MSYLTYLAAARPLEQVPWPENIHFIIDTENHTSRTEPETWFAVTPFAPGRMDSVFTEKPYAAEISWEGAAEQKTALLRNYLARQEADEVELWKIWMCGMERPCIKTRAIPLSALTAEEIGRIEAYDPFNDVIPLPALAAEEIERTEAYDSRNDIFDGALPVQRCLVIRREKEKGSD